MASIVAGRRVLEGPIDPVPIADAGIDRQMVIKSLDICWIPELLDREIIERLALQEKPTHLNSAARYIQKLSGLVFEALVNAGKIPEKVAGTYRDYLSVSALLHDIGKSGGLTATLEQQEVIVALFAVDRNDIAGMSIGEVLRLRPEFDETQTDKFECELKAAGIDLSMNMRAFWDTHAYHTREILDAYSVTLPLFVRIVAASHHWPRINPYNIQDWNDLPEALDGLFENARSEQERADIRKFLHLACMILTAADIYEARIHRGGRTHTDAIRDLREFIPREYGEDEDMQQIIKIMEDLGNCGLLPERRKW